MNKVDLTGQRKRSKGSKHGTGMGANGRSDGKGDELPWTRTDTAWMFASEIYLGLSTLGAPGLMMVGILLVSAFLHIFVEPEQQDARAREAQRRQVNQARVEEQRRKRANEVLDRDAEAERRRREQQSPEQREEEDRARQQREQAKLNRWQALQSYLPGGGGASALEMPPDPMLPRHARLSRVLETPGINIVLLKTGKPFRWEVTSSLDIAYFRIFDHFRNSRTLNFFESRQEWFGPSVLAKCNEVQRRLEETQQGSKAPDKRIGCIVHGNVAEPGRDPAELEAAPGVFLVAVRNKVRGKEGR